MGVKMLDPVRDWQPRATSRKAHLVTHDGDAWDNFDWDSASDGTPVRGPGDEHQHKEEHEEEHEEEHDGAPSLEGEWISQGGVLHWEEAEGTPEDVASDLRREARSPWASETLTLPLGAPDALRVRGVRAWLARQRMLENEAMGVLLLERRQQAGRQDGDNSERRAQASNEGGPLENALGEHQAAQAEYEALLAALDEVGMHNGPGRVLVEYHFLLGDRIAALAAMAEAPDDFAELQLFAAIERTPGSTPVTARSRAEWDGRAGALLQTRRRVERMTAPEEEE